MATDLTRPSHGHRSVRFPGGHALGEHRRLPGCLRLPSPHHRRAVVMDQQPLIADEFEKVRREDLGLLRFVGLLSGEILDADDPSHIACHLNQDLGEFELHGEGVIEDQHPGIADGRPPRTNRPARVNTSDVFLMSPDLVHPGDVKTLKSFVECLVGFRDGFDTLFQHAAPLSQRSRIILQASGALRGYFSGESTRRRLQEQTGH